MTSDTAEPDAPRVECLAASGMVTATAPAGDTIVFHDPMGAVLASSVIDATQTASYTLAPCSMVSVVHRQNGAVDVVFTISDVMPGDALRFGEPDIRVTDQRDVSLTWSYGAGAQYAFHTGACMVQTIAIPATLTVPNLCYTNVLNVLALNGSPPFAYSVLEDIPLGAPGSTITGTMSSWRQDFATVQVSVSNRPPALFRTRAAIAPNHDGLRFADQLFAAELLPKPIQVPKFGETATITVTASGETPGGGFVFAQDVIATPLPSSYNVDIAAEVPFVISEQHADGANPPTLTWTTGSSAGDGVFVCATWQGVSPNGHWCVLANPARVTTARFPSLPAGLWPTTPPSDSSISIVESNRVADYAAMRATPFNLTGSSNPYSDPDGLRVRKAQLGRGGVYVGWPLP